MEREGIVVTSRGAIGVAAKFRVELQQSEPLLNPTGDQPSRGHAAHIANVKAGRALAEVFVRRDDYQNVDHESDRDAMFLFLIINGRPQSVYLFHQPTLVAFRFPPRLELLKSVLDVVVLFTWVRHALDVSRATAYNASKEIETSERSGTRPDRCGFFVPGSTAGRGRIEDPQGEEVHRLRSGFNLPATLPAAFETAPARFIELTQEHAMSPSLTATKPVLAVIDGHVTTTSQHVADFFTKDHSKVLRDIRALADQTGESFAQSNFGLSEYLDPTGRKLPAYRLTRDGFALLAMGFTGKKAMFFKLAYIDAFNRMESALRAAEPPTAEYSPREFQRPTGSVRTHFDLPAELQLRVKVLAAQRDVYMRDIVITALSLFVRKAGVRLPDEIKPGKRITRSQA